MAHLKVNPWGAANLSLANNVVPNGSSKDPLGTSVPRSFKEALSGKAVQLLLF